MNWKKIILSAFILQVGFSACKKNTQPQKKEGITATNNTYEADWKTIDKMEQKGLGNSIVTKVDTILLNALAEENTAQVFKALAYRSKYYNQLIEESNLKIFIQYEAQIENSKFPLKQLLHSATAELYYQYYNQNRWKFQSRTTTQDFNKKDLRTWSLGAILEKVAEHYQSSLTEKENLLSYPIDNLKAILHLPDAKKSKNQFEGKNLQPTLFDFLANRALNYYKVNEGRVPTPLDEFKFDDYIVFSSTQEFSKIDFTSTDKNSNDLKTALLYQELIDAHQDDKNKSPLLQIELSRLRHYYSTSQKTNKDNLYMKALATLQQNFRASENAAEIEYTMAKYHYDQGSNYSKVEGENYKLSLKKAHQICSASADDRSYGAIQCQNLMSQIEKKTLSLKTERVYLPSEEISYIIEAKNIDSLYFKLIRIPNTIESHQDPNEKAENYIKRLRNSNIQREWKERLTNPKDFLDHSYEFSSKSLATGKYILIASTKSDFANQNAITNYIDFQVSELSFISKNENKGIVNFYVLNRATGNPIANTKLTSYYKDYNYKSRKSELKITDTYTADKNGFARITSNEKRRNFNVLVTFKGDTLNNSDSFYSRNYTRTENKEIEAFLFTDRAIYRPGQTIYFKGIVLERGGKSNRIMPNYLSEISLQNANAELVSKLVVTTNDYGSYQGSFTLPSSGLNGRYFLRAEGGNLPIQVEEYKRPTFEVTLDTNKKSAKINQDISISGSILAFSGAKVSAAKVKYRIQRKTSFPWWGYRWERMPRTTDKEIANGETVADSEGNFAIPFFAAADEGVASRWSPNYNFEVTIDATSPSGETQSLSETITLGTKEVYLSSNLSVSLQLDELKNFIIHAKNIQGVELIQKLNYTLYRLKTPKTLQRKTYWETAEYSDNKLPAKANNELHEFERGPELLKGIINNNSTSDIFGNLPVGAYELVATTMNGEASDFIHRFELFDEDSKQLAIQHLFDFKPIKMQAKPGEEVIFIIGSSLKDVKLLYEINLDGKRISQKWISLDDEQRKITVPIKESYRGGIQVSFIGVYNNREISETRPISVPFSNKKLKLILGTYRNKVEPGGKEKWTITIGSLKGDKVAAELLAGMYDQSLDQFKTQDWNMSLYSKNQNTNSWQTDGAFWLKGASQFGNRRNYNQAPQRVFPYLNWFGFSLQYLNPVIQVDYMMASPSAMQRGGSLSNDVDYETGAAKEMKSEAIPITHQNAPKLITGSALTVKSITSKNPERVNTIRSDFRETAFFYPQLRTDKNGSVSFEFEMPDALTKWEFRALAHTKDLKVGTTETTIQTQKELMVSPTVPRFFREGDQLDLKVLVTNLSENSQSGTAQIQFFDAFTNKAIIIANGSAAAQKFNLFSGKNTALAWSIRIPNGLRAIKYVVTANSENFSDGEEKVIPVLPNRKLVTESLPLAIRGNQQKQFVFDKLVDNSSKTLVHESFTLEFTSNPAWYAVQALPYVVESTSECSEQIFAKLYANLLAQKIANSNPKIQEVFNLWKDLDSKELTSKLMQNQELKSILIEETPWLQQAKSETEQKKRIALLFDFNRMAVEKSVALKKLQELQLPNGGWAWYKGMRHNRYITQYIIEGFGHLKQLGVDLSSEPGMDALVNNGLDYLDKRINEDYERLKGHSADLSKNHLNQTQIHYLYTRSFFLEREVPESSKAFDYYLKQAEQFWLERNLYMKGMQALVLRRFNPASETPKDIVASLRDNALQTEQMGMYWKENQAGYYWHSSPVETQAMMVEVFHEVAEDKNAVEELRIWLLKEKQTQMWSNSKATALACYALLIDNVTSLVSGSEVLIKVGRQELTPTDAEAGTGYFKQVWTKSEVQAGMGSIQVKKASDGIAWGAAYWQYYEDLDKITSANVGEFSVSKTIYKVVVDSNGEKMLPIDASGIEIGDKIRVRLRIKSKRNVEFVHVKDMRASGFEPINVISRYKYQDGLGYYESTKDASTNFFMDRVKKGVYVFEYNLRATVSGEFSNGVCTLQCQYAPEFSTHSKGKRLSIQD